MRSTKNDERCIPILASFSTQVDNVLPSALQPAQNRKATIHPVYVLEFPMTDEEGAVLREPGKLQRIYDAQRHIVRINTTDNFMGDLTLNQQLQNRPKATTWKTIPSTFFNDTREKEGIIHFAEEVR